MARNNSPTFNRIKYKDLAIAVALSGASLLLFPSTTKAATNETSPADPTTSTLVQKNNEATNSAITANTTTGSITPPVLNQNDTNNTTSTADVSSDETSNSASSLSTTLTNTNNTGTTNNSQVITSVAGNATTSSTSDSTTGTTTTEPSESTNSSFTVDNNNKIIPAYNIPDSGMTITNIPNSTMDSNGQYSVSIQGVYNNGQVIGKSVVVGYGSPNSSTTLNSFHLPQALLQSMSSVIGGVNYANATWSNDYKDQPLSINFTNADVMISVYC